jgi:outer membrane receptor protein involved in Fe transport
MSSGKSDICPECSDSGRKGQKRLCFVLVCAGERGGFVGEAGAAALTRSGRITPTSGPIDKLDKPRQKNVTAAQLFHRPVTVVDAFASDKLRDDAVLNVSAESLANRNYLDPPAQSFMPAPGRTFRASLTMRF